PYPVSRVVFSASRVVALVAAIGFAGMARAQDEPVPQTPPVAEQPSLDEQIFGPGVTPVEDDAPAEKPLELDEKIEQLLSGEQAADLFKEVIGDMGEAAENLGVKRDAGLTTQRLQEDILKKLDQVIATAEKQQQQG